MESSNKYTTDLQEAVREIGRNKKGEGEKGARSEDVERNKREGS